LQNVSVELLVSIKEALRFPVKVPQNVTFWHTRVGCQYGAPFVKILYLTDLAQKLLSLCIF